MPGQDELRKRALHARRAFSPAARAKNSCAICRAIGSLEIYRNASIIMAYLAFDGEPELADLIQEAERAGKTVCYPYCASDTEIIALHPLSDGAIALGRYGIRTPEPALSEEIAPEDIGLVLVPCAAFDAKGRRVGMGAGYYDRFLPKCKKAVRALVANDCQRVDAITPKDTDAKMDLIVTEKGMEKIGK